MNAETEREDVRGIADLSISTAATTPYSLTLLKTPPVRIPLRFGNGRSDETKREREVKSVLKSRGSPISGLSYITFFFRVFAATIIISRLRPLSIALLDAPRWRRRLDEIFIETPTDYSEAMPARGARETLANSRDCEFIW